MFALSKVMGLLVDPRSVLFAALIIGAVLLWTRARTTGRWLVTLSVGVAVLFDTGPAGFYALEKLEYRFPAPSQAFEKVDGIIVLGGDFNAGLAEVLGPRIAAPSRLVALATLARRYPEARLIFSGGSGSVVRPELKESELAKPILADLGVDIARVTFESDSRNTVENAIFTYRAAQPNPGETWLLITTASHMPRTMGTFRRAGWTAITPYPVEFYTHPQLRGGIGVTFDAGLNPFSIAFREVVGLAYYYALGRTDALFPGP
jgi:uncharacterized SAM-binding protein YcdF (DUF218 family)